MYETLKPKYSMFLLSCSYKSYIPCLRCAITASGRKCFVMTLWLPSYIFTRTEINQPNAYYYFSIAILYKNVLVMNELCVLYPEFTRMYYIEVYSKEISVKYDSL